jgi:hypothetical protein
MLKSMETLLYFSKLVVINVDIILNQLMSGKEFVVDKNSVIKF